MKKTNANTTQDSALFLAYYNALEAGDRLAEEFVALVNARIGEEQEAVLADIVFNLMIEIKQYGMKPVWKILCGMFQAAGFSWPVTGLALKQAHEALTGKKFNSGAISPYGWDKKVRAKRDPKAPTPAEIRKDIEAVSEKLKAIKGPKNGVEWTKTRTEALILAKALGLNVSAA